MHSFNEELLHFIWKHKLLKPVPYFSTKGAEIQILRQGELNQDSGPDFFNAHIKINGLVLVGNVEIHLKSSDWLKHKHQYDKAYDTIILHVVYEHDKELVQNIQHSVEVLELKSFIEESILEKYVALASTNQKLPCSAHLKAVNDFKFLNWLERMTVERLEEKVKRFENWFNHMHRDFTQTFYISLLRNFGFKVNALPFELLAKQLPVNLLLKHADNLLQVEALLFGMSGLLEDQFEDTYACELQNEFQFLKTKYSLIPLKKEIFKFSKLRPANFPTLRLAQFAMLIHTRYKMLISPHLYVRHYDWRNALQINLTGYWQHHYTFHGKKIEMNLNFGKQSAENVIVNTVAPFFFFWSKKLAKSAYSDISLHLLESCMAEKNSKTKLFEDKVGLVTSAAQTQAIVNLYDNYCRFKKCLRCGIAAGILNEK